jgi:hypothetical protein
MTMAGSPDKQITKKKGIRRDHFSATAGFLHVTGVGGRIGHEHTSKTVPMTEGPQRQ